MRHIPRVAFFAAPLAATLLASAAVARDEVRPVAAALGDAVESCVDTTILRFGKVDRRVMLDAAETTAAGESFIRRYPAFAQTSPAPTNVVLWNKPGGGWVYVALLANPAKPGELCFTASFAAERFPETPGLLKKYFGIEAI